MQSIKRLLLASGILCLSLAFACSTDRSPQEKATMDTEAVDSSAQDQAVLEDEQNTVHQQPVDELKLPDLTELEQAIIEADEEDFYLVYTEKGFDYVVTDLNGDGIEDVAALRTFEHNPNNYDNETIVYLMIYTGNKNGTFHQTEGNSQNLGGESIRYKSIKKLVWEDEKLTYFHQSMRTHIEVDIKIEDFYGKAYLTRVSTCSYDDSGCKDLYVASEQQDTVALSALSLEFLDSIR